MAKKKTEDKNIEAFESDLDDFLKSSMDLEVTTLGEHEQVPYWINSGSYALNWVIADDMFKGIPGTKVVMVSGEEAKGKSLVSDVWLGQTIRDIGSAIKIDVEDSIGRDFTAKVIGSEEIASKIRLIAPDTKKEMKKKNPKPENLVITIEKLTHILNKVIDFQLSKGSDIKPIMVVIDSVSNLTSIKEIQDIADEKDKKDMTPQQKMRAFFRAVNQKMKNAQVTIVGIAHLTANIGVMFGPSKTVSAKGSGFKYASSLILNCVSSKEIVDPKTDTAVGVRMKIQTTKNRMAFKGRNSFLYMYFNYGIDPYGGIGELLCQYDLAKASAKAKVDGSFGETTTFTYLRDNGETMKWKTYELWSMMEAMKEEERQSLLEEWNNKLNNAYQKALDIRGISEEEYLEEEDPQSDEEFFDEMEQE